MKISYNWLRQYIDINNSPDELSEILTDIGLEVEGIQDWVSIEGGLKGVVIGEVKTCCKHPNADKLTVTTVDIGEEEELKIVCGAPNVKPGQKVPVATIGTVLKYKDGDFVIKKSKIRGELSEGMICAEDELGLGSSHEGIMELPQDVSVGLPACEYFPVEYDTVFEIGLTPNRIDGGSHYGVARDLAAWFNLSKPTLASLPSVKDFKIDNTGLEIPVIIENEKDCLRYSGLTINNITVGESPVWLKNKLRAIGLAPINNIVDITNYVLHETGQPLHAFDTKMISGDKVIVKNLPSGTKFTTLDEVNRKLSSKDLMICDEKNPMCIAGVFGGIGSGVGLNTKSVFLESACFNPISVRKTARRHDLHTDASFRFERGSDPNMTIRALKRAALLIKEIAGGTISSGIVDVYPNKIKEIEIEISYNNINRLIGKTIDKKIISSILESLDINILKSNKDLLMLAIPAYRVDVTREADVIEEILRIYGYNNIEISKKVNSTLTFIEKPDKEKVVNTISDMLSGFGFTEIMSNSLNPYAWYEDNPDFNNSKIVMLANPLSSDLNCMRQSLLLGGLNAVSRNINRQNNDLLFYEFGNCYFISDKKSKSPTVDNYFEKLSLDLFVTGNQKLENWNNKAIRSDFFFIKTAAEMVLEKLGVNLNSVNMEEVSESFYSEGLSYYINDTLIANFGKLNNEFLMENDIKQDLLYAHIEWDAVFKLIRKQKISFRELPKYPSVRRDLALLINKDVQFKTIKRLAFKTEKNLLQQIGLFDVYENETLGKNKKSYAVSFFLRDNKKTLTDKTIDKVMNSLIRVFKQELDAEIR